MKAKRCSIALAMFVLLALPLPAQAAELLIPVGKTIGLQLSDDTVTIVAFDDVLGGCSREAGLKIGDEIVEIEDRCVRSPEDVRNALNTCDDDVDVTVRRLREKIEVDPASPVYILTRRGAGYYFAV